MRATIDFSGSEKLLEALKAVPRNVEEELNKFLKVRGTKRVIEEIVGIMPVSSQKNPHAKDSNPLTFKMAHLGFTITTKPKFNYLIFPNDGIGRSNPTAQKFFETGVAQSENPLLDEVLEVISKQL